MQQDMQEETFPLDEAGAEHLALEMLHLQKERRSEERFSFQNPAPSHSADVRTTGSERGPHQVNRRDGASEALSSPPARLFIE